MSFFLLFFLGCFIRLFIFIIQFPKKNHKKTPHISYHLHVSRSLFLVFTIPVRALLPFLVLLCIQHPFVLWPLLSFLIFPFSSNKSVALSNVFILFISMINHSTTWNTLGLLSFLPSSTSSYETSLSRKHDGIQWFTKSSIVVLAFSWSISGQPTTGEKRPVHQLLFRPMTDRETPLSRLWNRVGSSTRNGLSLVRFNLPCHFFSISPDFRLFKTGIQQKQRGREAACCRLTRNSPLEL